MRRAARCAPRGNGERGGGEGCAAPRCGAAAGCAAPSGEEAGEHAVQPGKPCFRRPQPALVFCKPARALEFSQARRRFVSEAEGEVARPCLALEAVRAPSPRMSAGRRGKNSARCSSPERIRNSAAVAPPASGAPSAPLPRRSPRTPVLRAPFSSSRPPPLAPSRARARASHASGDFLAHESETPGRARRPPLPPPRWCVPSAPAPAAPSARSPAQKPRPWAPGPRAAYAPPRHTARLCRHAAPGLAQLETS